MMTLDERLNAMAALLPEKDRGRFTAPLAEGESIDSRLVEAARALAKTEGLMCLTHGEFSRALVQQAARLAMPASKATAADEKPAGEGIAARFAAITDPRAQTAFWRSLTANQRAAIHLDLGIRRAHAFPASASAGLSFSRILEASSRKSLSQSFTL